MDLGMEIRGSILQRGTTEKEGPGESVYDVQHNQTHVGEGRLPDLQYSAWDGGTNGSMSLGGEGAGQFRCSLCMRRGQRKGGSCPFSRSDFGRQNFRR